MKIVFIASLVHSGSTALDLAFGTHPRLVGVGEIAGLLDPVHRHLDRRGEIVCSCGDPLDRCPFWGPYTASIDDEPEVPIGIRYRMLAKAFGAHFGGDRLLVDSSKAKRGIDAWQGVPGTEVRAIHLVRDVRGWALSMDRLDRRLGRDRFAALVRQDGLRAIPARWRRTTIGRFREWHARNLEIERALTERDVPALRVGYEELCLEPERTLGAVAEFLDVEPFPNPGSLADSSSHVALGNRMHGQKEKRDRLAYDARWMRRRWSLAELACGSALRYNARHAYGNLRDGRFGR